MIRTLSGRLLVLTAIFVMLAEVMIFVPSVARYREDYLTNRLERAQIASLALLASDTIDPALEVELLQNAQVYNVVLRRDQVRELALSSPIPSPISATFDMRDPTAWELIQDAMVRLVNSEDQVVRVIGNPVREGGQLIEITLSTAPLRAEMIDYGIRILILSAIISVLVAGLLFLAVQRLIVRPIKVVIGAMETYRQAPQDARRIIEPSASVSELRQAETALRSLQTQLTGSLRQKERLAQLGAAVAKISHDLRNVLTTTQLFADRLEGSQDPKAARVAPKLLASISRAISICEGTLAFGRADEPPPSLSHVTLAQLVEDVVEGERLAAGDDVRFEIDIPKGFEVRADAEQLFRVLSNLARNARQAIDSSGKSGEIRLAATDDPGEWAIFVSDTGPGMPERARIHLFEPFQATSRGGTGLGLAIAQELVRGHGGDLSLVETGPGGTIFRIVLPKTVVRLDAAE